MGPTNAVYTFKRAGEGGQDVHIYHEMDAYPLGAAAKLQRAFAQVPMMDPLALLKTSRILSTAEPMGMEAECIHRARHWRAVPVTNYRYEVNKQGAFYFVKVFVPLWKRGAIPKQGENFSEWKCIFKGPFSKFTEWANRRGYPCHGVA